MPKVRDHVVIVGWGRVGGHIVEVLGRLGVPRLVVEADAARAEELLAHGVPVLFGDAANSEILDHAGLERARALVVTIPDEAAAGLAVAAARRLAPRLPIVARAATQRGMRHLTELGASDVIQPELEGGLQVVRHTLLRLGFPLREVQKYGDVVRREAYDVALNSQAEHARSRTCSRPRRTSRSPGRPCPREAGSPARPSPRPTSAPAPARRWSRSTVTVRSCPGPHPRRVCGRATASA